MVCFYFAYRCSLITMIVVYFPLLMQWQYATANLPSPNYDTKVMRSTIFNVLEGQTAFGCKRRSVSKK